MKIDAKEDFPQESSLGGKETNETNHEKYDQVHVTSVMSSFGDKHDHVHSNGEEDEANDVEGQIRIIFSSNFHSTIH